MIARIGVAVDLGDEAADEDLALDVITLIEAIKETVVWHGLTKQIWLGLGDDEPLPLADWVARGKA